MCLETTNVSNIWNTSLIYLLFFRAYAAWCDQIESDPALENQERIRLSEYSSKLKLGEEGDMIPDPLTLKVNWLKEKDENGILK